MSWMLIWWKGQVMKVHVCGMGIKEWMRKKEEKRRNEKKKEEMRRKKKKWGVKKGIKRVYQLILYWPWPKGILEWQLLPLQILACCTWVPIHQRILNPCIHQPFSPFHPHPRHKIGTFLCEPAPFSFRVDESECEYVPEWERNREKNRERNRKRENMIVGEWKHSIGRKGRVSSRSINRVIMWSSPSSSSSREPFADH